MPKPPQASLTMAASVGAGGSCGGGGGGGDGGGGGGKVRSHRGWGHMC